jgi:hypothetical protein
MTYNLWKLDDHPELVSALFAAHREAAIVNDNASKVAVQQAWGGSGRFENAMIAGLATIGALHAPLVAARDLWLECDPLERGSRYPGFGNSFHPEGDPAFRRVSDVLDRLYRDAFNRVEWLEHDISKERGMSLTANAALYTAIVASICEVPRGLESALFALARIPAWAEMCGAVQHPVVGGVR